MQVYNALQETLKSMLDIVMLIVCGHEGKGRDEKEPSAIPEGLRTELRKRTSGHSSSPPVNEEEQSAIPEVFCTDMHEHTFDHSSGPQATSERKHIDNASSQNVGPTATDLKYPSVPENAATRHVPDRKKEQAVDSSKPLLISSVVQKCCQSVASLLEGEVEALGEEGNELGIPGISATLQSDRVRRMLPGLASFALSKGANVGEGAHGPLDDSRNYLAAFGHFLPLVHSAVCAHTAAEAAVTWRELCAGPKVLAALAVYLVHTQQTIVVSSGPEVQEPQVLGESMITQLQKTCAILEVAISHVSEVERDAATWLLVPCYASGGLLGDGGNSVGRSCDSLIMQGAVKVLCLVKNVLNTLTDKLEEFSGLAPVKLVLTAGQLLAVCVSAQGLVRETEEPEQVGRCLAESVRFAAALQLTANTPESDAFGALLRLPRQWWPAEATAKCLALAVEGAAEAELDDVLECALRLCAAVKACCAAQGDVERYIRGSSWMAGGCARGEVASLLNEFARDPGGAPLLGILIELCS